MQHLVVQFEEIGVDKALNRVCALDVSSPNAVPGDSLSAMDGYAVRSRVTAFASSSRPVSLRVVGSMYPGSLLPVNDIGLNEAWYVATGALLPRGADAVVKVEETKLKGESVTLGRPIAKGKNVLGRGDDVRPGQVVLRKGEIINSAAVALLMAVGIEKLTVFRIPRVGVLSVGDELQAYSPGSERSRVNNYATLLLGYLSALGLSPSLLGVVSDEPRLIGRLVSENLDSLDLLITIGGTSVGARDRTPDSLAPLADSHLLFHGVRVVPIKPTGITVAKGKPIVMLPANAVSTALSFFVIALPAINIVSGLAFESRALRLSATLSEGVKNPRPMDAIYLVELFSSEGELTGSPIGWGSNINSNLARANGFIWLAPRQSLRKGTQVAVSLLGPLELQRLKHG